MSKSLLFILNPKSGQGQVLPALGDVIDIMVKAGFEVRVYTTQCRGDATRIVIEEGERYDRIVCSGGDGTLGEVVKGIVEGKVNRPVGYIPAGTTNDFARSLGLPFEDPLLAASVAVGENYMDCDAAEFCGEIFLYAAAFGLFSAASYATPQPLKNIFGHLAYVLEGSKELYDVPDYTLGDVKIQGEYEIVKELNALNVIENIAEGINGIREDLKNINPLDGSVTESAEAVGESVRKASENILKTTSETVEVDDRKDESANYSLLGKYILGMATNSSSIGGISGITGNGIDLCDGMLEMTLIKRPDNVFETHQIIMALNSVGPSTNFDSPLVRRIKLKEVSMEFTEPVPFTLDGEYGGEHKTVTIKTLPAAFKIFVEHKG